MEIRRLRVVLGLGGLHATSALMSFRDPSCPRLLDVTSPASIIRASEALQRWARLRIIQNYERLLVHGLSDGLSIQEVRQLRVAQNPFAVDDKPCKRRRRLKRQLERIGNAFCRIEKDEQKRTAACQKACDRILRRPLSSWLPSLVKSTDIAFGDGLAPRTQHANQMKSPDEIILYVIPSPFGFDWSTPRKWFWSLRNYLVIGKHHRIGHMAVELRRAGATRHLTGMTGETNLQVLKKLVFQKIGLNFLWYIFPGRLDSPVSCYEDIKRHFAKRRIGYIRIPVTKSVYSQAEDFLEKWCSEGHYQKYGLVFEPRRHFGAGCTSFGVEFLKIAGVFCSSLQAQWRQTVRIPTELIHRSGQGYKVGPFKLLRYIFLRPQSAQNWCRNNDTHARLSFWDPDRIHTWLCNPDSRSRHRHMIEEEKSHSPRICGIQIRPRKLVKRESEASYQAPNRQSPISNCFISQRPKNNRRFASQAT